VGVTPEISERQTYGETKRGVQHRFLKLYI
jgi:hypothetical protein